MAKKNLLSWPVYAIGALAGLGLLIIIIWRSGFSNFLGYLLRVRPLPIVAAIAVYSSAWWVRTLRIGMLSRFCGKNLSWIDLFRYSISSFAINALFPAKIGDLALIGYLRMAAMPTGLAAAMVFQLRLLDAAAVAMGASLLLPLSLGLSSPSWLTMSLPVPLLAIGAIVFLILLDRKKGILLRLEGRVSRSRGNLLSCAARTIREAVGGFHELLKSGHLVSRIFLVSILIWFLEGLTAWSVATSLGFSLSPMLLFFALYAANLGKTIPLTPGGLGVYEGLMAAILTLGGMPYSQAISLAVCDHLLKKLFNLGLGIPATAVSGVSLAGLIKSLARGPQMTESNR